MTILRTLVTIPGLPSCAIRWLLVIGAKVSGTLVIKISLIAVTLRKPIVTEFRMIETVVFKAIAGKAVTIGSTTLEVTASWATLGKLMMIGPVVLRAVLAAMVKAMMLEPIPTKIGMMVMAFFAEVLVFGAFAREPLLVATVMPKIISAKAGMIEPLVAGAVFGIAAVVGGTQHIGQHALADLDRDLLFLSFAEERERRAAVFSGGVDEDGQLPRIDDLLIVIELQHIELLESRRGRRAIRQYSIDDQSEIFGQVQLRGHNWWHWRGGDPDVGDGFLGWRLRVLVASGTVIAGSLRAIPLGMPKVFAPLLSLLSLAVGLSRGACAIRTMSAVPASERMLIRLRKCGDSAGRCDGGRGWCCRGSGGRWFFVLSHREGGAQDGGHGQ